MNIIGRILMNKVKIIYLIFKFNIISRNWADGRAVDGSGLENRRRATYRGFESLSARHDG